MLLACLIRIYIIARAEHVILKNSCILASVLAVDFFVDEDVRQLLVPVDSSMWIYNSRSLKHGPDCANLFLAQ